MSELLEKEEEKNDSEQQSQPASLGAVLEAARLAKNLTQQDVSDSLRYSVRQINALEKCEFDLLPDAMITRGFIRNYARLLEIDAEPLLASYRQSISSEPGKVITVQSSIRPVLLTKESQPWLKYMLASILVLLFLLAWLFYVDYMPKPTSIEVAKTPEVVTEAAPAATEPLPEIALPAAQRQADAAAADLVVDPNAALNNTAPAAAAADVKPADVSVQPDVKSAPAALMQVPSQVAAPTNAVVTKPADKTVSMTFTAQTWVSITDKSGKVIYEKMSHNGDKETINITPPLNMVIGNASGTKLNFGGRDIDLAPNTKNNVARIALE